MVPALSKVKPFLVAAALLLAACTGGSAAPPAPPPPPPPPPPAAAPAAPTPRPSNPSPSPSDPCGPSEGRGDPARYGEGLFSLQMVSDEAGWAVGRGLILATVDGGQRWIPQLRTPEVLTFVNAVDRQHVWAVGISSLLGTEDGGATWKPLGEPPRPLTTVHFVDPQHGWGMTDAGLYESTDGGRSWSPLPVPCGAQAVCFSDQAQGWLGSRGRVYRTTNGGRSWALAFEVPGWEGFGSVGGLQCTQGGVVWVQFLGTNGAMTRFPYVSYRGTADGQWTPLLKGSLGPRQVQAPGGAGRPGPISAISASEAALITYNYAADLNLVLVSDGGSAKTERPPVRVANDATPVSASFRSATLGWMVTGFRESRILVTRDGGVTWQVQYPTP